MDSPNSMPQGKGISRVVQVTLDRLAPLLGEWTGRGRGGFPTLEEFDYLETLRVHRDQDATYLTYEQNTELIDADGRSMRKSHWEAGVIRPLEDGSIELACVHGSGRVEVLRGKFLAQESQPGRFFLRFESALIGNDARVRISSREWNLSGKHFTYMMKMATMNVGALTNHLEATLIKK
ncbi:MAG TPA: FABP family protein [Anaerolineales bacterium]